MRAACKLGAEVREFAGTLVKVSKAARFIDLEGHTQLACSHNLSILFN